MAILSGTFISDYEEGHISIDGTINTDTGEIFAENEGHGPLATIFDYGSLLREHFDVEGKKYEVCTKCHKYILTQKHICSS